MVGIKRPLKTAQNEQPARAGPSTLSDTSDTDEPLAKRHKTQPAEASTSRLRPVTSAPSRAFVHQTPQSRGKTVVDKGKGKAVASDEHNDDSDQDASNDDESEGSGDDWIPENDKQGAIEICEDVNGEREAERKQVDKAEVSLNSK